MATFPDLDGSRLWAVLPLHGIFPQICGRNDVLWDLLWEVCFQMRFVGFFVGILFAWVSLTHFSQIYKTLHICNNILIVQYKDWSHCINFFIYILFYTIAAKRYALLWIKWQLPLDSWMIIQTINYYTWKHMHNKWSFHIRILVIVLHLFTERN